MPALPQFSLKEPIYSIFIKYGDENKGDMEELDFIFQCIREGVERIRSNKDFFRACPLMETQYEVNPTKKVFYSPKGDADLTGIASSMLHSRGIGSKRMLVREATLWFLDTKGIISLKPTEILIRGPRVVRS